MLRRTEEEICYLGIDEKSSEKGHSYATILTDIGRSRVLDLVPERKLEAAKTPLETLTPRQRASVKAVAMDMCPAFMSAAKACMPQADIVHDKFHVAKYLGEAVDAVQTRAPPFVRGGHIAVDRQQIGAALGEKAWKCAPNLDLREKVLGNRGCPLLLLLTFGSMYPFGE